MRLAASLICAGCVASSPSDGPPTDQELVGSGSVVIDGVVSARSAWMMPMQFSDDEMPDAPTRYLGWDVVFADNPAGSPCSDVEMPSWSAQVFVSSATQGSVPEDAPITPGAFDVTMMSASPDAGVQAWVNGPVVADAGTVTISAFDDEHIEGSFSATGQSSDLPPVPFTVTGSFDANRCDF